MAQKVTTMVINVDLQCPTCYKEIKKLLGKFPEIQDRVYDEKQNTVTITVVSCCPERIRDKLCYKGGKTIKNIEIKPSPKPKELEKKHKEPEKMPKDAEKPKETEKKLPKEVYFASKSPECAPFPVSSCATFYPCNGPCCGPCCNGYGPYGYGEGPCNQAYGRPVPWYDNYGYGPYGYCGNTGHYLSPHVYCSEENSSICTIM